MRTAGSATMRGIALVAAGSLFAGAALAGEQPAGDVLDANGMRIIAVYLQPVKMEPSVPDQDPAKTDIHLEADIHALPHNPSGFPEDSWIPYLSITYELGKEGSQWRTSGTLRPMIANDGPHYGANVKLDGPGAYRLRFKIAPPPGHDLMRHTDKETGVDPWWAPFEYAGGFKFIGTGKKGGY